MDIKQISTEIIHANPWWKYCHDKYSLIDKQECDYFYCTTKGAVMIVPILENGKLILTRQYRYLHEKNSIEFPCGAFLDENESALEAAKRELLEETGYLTDDLVKMGEFEPDNGFCKDNTRVFITSDLKQVGQPQNMPNEIIEVMYRRVDEFDAMIKRGEVWDGITLAAWMLCRDYVYNLIE